MRSYEVESEREKRDRGLDRGDENSHDSGTICQSRAMRTPQFANGWISADSTHFARVRSLFAG
jgi:hypothetical protein